MEKIMHQVGCPKTFFERDFSHQPYVLSTEKTKYVFPSGHDLPGILRDDLELNLREVDDDVDEANIQEDVCPVCATTSSTPHPYKPKCFVAFPKRGRDEFCNLVYVLIHGERVWSDSCLRLVRCKLEIWG